MPTATKDYYMLLDLVPGASHDEIKRAYRRKALACHPDRGGAPARMKALNEAWAVLGDPEARREYDSERRLLESAPPVPSTPPNGRVPGPSRSHAAAAYPVIDVLFSLLRPLAFRLGRALNRVRKSVARLFR